MWEWVDHLGVLLLDAGVSVLVLWAVASLAMMGSRQPARRVLIARAATVGSLTFLPLIGSGLVPQYDMTPVFKESWVFSDPPTTRAIPDLVWSARVLTLGYAAAVAGGLGWLVLGYAGMARVVRDSCQPSTETQALLGSLPFPAGRRRPGVRVAARVRRPGLVGLARPLILIPPVLDQPEARDRLRLCLLHELAHAEARDTWSGLLENLGRVLWFFAPPFWWVAAQVRLDQEFLADRRAAQGYGPVRDYASSLLELASGRSAASGPLADDVGPWVDPAGTDGSALFQRLMMLVRCPFPVEPAPPPGGSVPSRGSPS